MGNPGIFDRMNRVRLEVSRSSWFAQSSWPFRLAPSSRVCAAGCLGDHHDVPSTTSRLPPHRAGHRLTFDGVHPPRLSPLWMLVWWRSRSSLRQDLLRSPAGHFRHMFVRPSSSDRAVLAPPRPMRASPIWARAVSFGVSCSSRYGDYAHTPLALVSSGTDFALRSAGRRRPTTYVCSARMVLSRLRRPAGPAFTFDIVLCVPAAAASCFAHPGRRCLRGATLFYALANRSGSQPGRPFPPRRNSFEPPGMPSAARDRV